MSKKVTSTLLLFAVFIGFLLWGLNTFISGLSSKLQGDDSVVYGILLLICSFTALIAILKLPSKKQP